MKKAYDWPMKDVKYSISDSVKKIAGGEFFLENEIEAEIH